MRYYKIIKDDQFIGVINSNNFVHFQPIISGFLIADEERGEYVNYNGLLYRSLWMKPLERQDIAYENAQIIEITEEQYIAFMQAIETNETIDPYPNDGSTVIEPANNTEEIDVESLAFVSQAKIKEMSYACRAAIENGFDIELNDGKIHHFSLSAQDQLNLLTLASAAETEELIPYHADGEPSTFFTASEIKQIIAAANAYKTYQTTYYNALKSYINSLTTIAEVSAITYGTPIPDEFQNEVLKVLLR